jgi:phage repressor protein C with HTH and peptisase S24 domain
MSDAPPNLLYQRIEKRQNVLGLSAAGASLAAGLSKAYIKNIKEGKSRSPRVEELTRLAVVLQTTVEWLTTGEGIEDIRNQQPVDRTSPGSFTPVTLPGRPLVGERNLPVFAAAMGGDGHHIVSFDAIDYVKRPSLLENVRDAYGIYIIGTSMIPAYEPGDLALVNPHLPPTFNANVVLYHVPPFNIPEAEAMVKRVIGYDDRDWNLRQYNPAKDFTESRADWPYCHRIVGKYDAR